MQTNILPRRPRDILLLVFSIIGIVGLAGRGIYLLLTGSLFLANSPSLYLASRVFGAFSSLGCAGLLVPLLIYSIRRLRGREILPASIPLAKGWKVAGLMALWILLLVLGSVINQQIQYGWLVALPFYLLGIAMPIVVVAWIALGGLPLGSRRRLWASFGIGMIGSTLGAMALEIVLAGIAVAAIGIVIAFNPEWLASLQNIRQEMLVGGDLQSVLTTLAPILTNPVVLLLALLFASVLAPMIEETLKPAAVWLLGKRLRSPAEGFALGALCGAGFALLEGSLAASSNSILLGFSIAARATSTLMHITASAVLGWGIGSARLEKRYGRLAWAYLLSLGIHGLWNGSVILAVFGALRLTLPGKGSDPLSLLLVITGFAILILLLVFILIFLPAMNHNLRRISPASVPLEESVIIAPPYP
jgi:hypothetical protein